MSAAPSPWTASASRRPGRLSWAGTVSKWPARSTSGRSPRAVAPASTQVSPASRASTPARAQHAEHVGGQRRLVARLGRDVDELERAGGEAIGQGHAPAD